MDEILRCRNDDLSFDDTIRFVAGCAKNMHAFPKGLVKEPAEVRLDELRKATKRVGSKVSRKPPPLEKYMLQWRQFASGESMTLDKGTVRYLCWESNIATSPLFLAYLHYSESRLSKRSLEGLVRSCHNRWESDFPESGSVATVRSFIEAYQGSNPVIRRWRATVDAVLGPNAPLLLCRDLVMKGERLTPFLNEWYLAPQSPFVGILVKEAAAECRKRLGSGSAAMLMLLFTDLLPWPYWKLHDLKEEVGQLILHAATIGRIRENLLSFVLSHKELGDPRVDENRMNWMDVSPKARNRFTEWLKDSNGLVIFDRVYRYGRGWAWQLRDNRWDAH